MADFYLGNGADEIELSFEIEGFGIGTRVFGENGRDTIIIHAEQVDGPSSLGFATGLFVDGGRGTDTITIRDAKEAQLRGGAGDDMLNVAGSSSTVSGGTGDDVLSARFSTQQGFRTIYFGAGNTLYGDNGNDTLESSGGNVLDGGRGDDTLISYSEFHTFYPPGSYLLTGSNTLTGGDGLDTFISSSIGQVHVAYGDEDGIVSEGDVIRGAMDVITDYAPGEQLRIGTTTETGGPVEVRPHSIQRHDDLYVPSGEYAAFRGTYDASMRGFTVDADGSDLLIAHDSFTINQPTPAVGLVTGAVVLIGVTSIDEVLIA